MLLVVVRPVYHDFFDSFIFTDLYERGIIERDSPSSFVILDDERGEEALLEFSDWCSVIRDDDGSYTYLSFAPLHLLIKIKQLKSSIIMRDVNENVIFTRFLTAFPSDTCWCVMRKNNIVSYQSYSLSIDDVEKAFELFCDREIKTAESLNSSMNSRVELKS